MKSTKLANGIRVVTDENQAVETATLGVWFRVGARQESIEENGLSHVLEHMAFKGTKSRTALDISSAIENVGGYLNAYTSRESTAYYARVLKQDSDLALDILSDILQNSTFSAVEWEREKGVILQEIGQTLDTPDDVVFDYFQEACFQNQSIGRSILGPSKNVEGFDREAIESYMKKHYCTHNMVVAAAGNINHDHFVKKVESHFANFSTNPPCEITPAQYVGGHNIQHKELEQVHLVMGFNGVKLGDDQGYAQMLSSTILGGGMSSRLFQEIREKRGLVYGIHAYASAYTDTGVFTIYAGTSGKDVNELIPVTIDEIKKAANHITDDELMRCKAQLKAALLMGMESTSGRCERLANQMLFRNKLISPKEIAEKIDGVEKTHIQHYLTNIFKETPTLSVLGPVSDRVSYDEFKQKVAA